MPLRARSELLDYSATVFYWGATGATLVWWLGRGDRIAFYLFLLGLACNFFDWRTGFAGKKARADDRRDALRFRGLYPREGEGNDEDVRRLRASGDKALAFVLFRELHGGSAGEAKRAVDALK